MYNVQIYIYSRLYWVDKNIWNEIKDKIENKTVVKWIKSETTYSKTFSYQVKYKTDHWNGFFCFAWLGYGEFIH